MRTSSSRVPSPSASKRPPCPLTDPKIGTWLKQSYRLDALLPSEEPLRTYLAVDERTGSQVIVQFLAASHATDAHLSARFRRRARALLHLRHPGCLRVVDVSDDHDSPYLVTQLVTGDLLATRLLVGGSMSVAAAIDLFDPILATLESAHAVGIIHGAVSPSRVALGGEGRSPAPRLFGFDLVASAFDAFDAFDDESENDGERRLEGHPAHGPAAYLSPEQCLGGAAGPRTDVYAIGAMLFEALTGRPPFVASDESAIRASHVIATPPSLAAAGRTDAPFDLEVGIAKALAKRAQDRPSAFELRGVLQRARLTLSAPVRCSA